MKLLKKPLALAAAAALGVGLISVVGAPAANADSGAFLSFTNAASSPTSIGNKINGKVVAGHACSASAVDYTASITGAPAGAGFPTAGVGSVYENGVTFIGTASVGAAQKNTATGFSFASDDTIDGIIANNAGTSFPVGTYTVTLQCRDSGLNITDTFTGKFTVTTAASGSGSGQFTGADLATTTYGTTTTITVPAAASVNASVGSTVPLTATVAPAAGVPTGFTVAGSVQFKYGATNIGSPVAVAAGSASTNWTVPSPANQSYAITAVFTPANGPVFPAAGYTMQYTGSTGAGKTVVVPPATATTVSVPSVTAGVTAGSGDTVTPVTVTASVTPAGAPGTVTFLNTAQGNASIGTISYNSGTGVATFSGTLPAGTYSLKATFTSANTDGFLNAPDSAAGASFTIVPVGVTETIVTTIAAGALNIAVAGDNFKPGPGTSDPAVGSNAGNVVNLGTATLDAAGTYFQSTGEMIPVVVIDTRAGDPGYDVRGQVTDFARSGGGGTINGANLFWAPAPYLLPKLNGAPTNTLPVAATGYGTGSFRPNVTLTAGTGALPPAGGAGFIPRQPGDTGGDPLSLKSSQRLFQTAANNGAGTAKYGAFLTLRAPTNTVAGTYQATLTLTAV